MKNPVSGISILLLSLVVASSGAAGLHLSYREAGLDERQAAAVLLDRFTFGAHPDEVEALTRQGLDRWFEQQLQAVADEGALGTRLAQYPALAMTHQQLFTKFPSSGQGTAHARRFFDLIPPADTPVDNAWVSRKLEQFRKEQAYQSQDTDLYQQLAGQKLARAVYAQNQLSELLTDFWQNHFYVSSSNFRSRPWVLAYESEAIRPHALGKFRDLLGAVAKHPARVQATLGDAQKASIAETETTLGVAFARLQQQGRQATIDAVKQQLDKIAAEEDLILQKRFWPESGPNQEYARLLLRQILGQGYGDRDVSETARVFTGWSTLPYGVTEQWFQGGFAAAASAGFVQQGSFVFRADRHDAKAKQVFGKRFAAGGGYEEGEQLLDVLAAQPAVAPYIATSFAKRFAGAEPSPALINALAKSFRDSDGDIRALLRTLVESREFWRAAAARERVKSPLEYAASALRATQAEMNETPMLVKWIADMGQPLYAHLDAAGVPQDKDWLSAGALTARVNFAAQLGAGQIKGVTLPAASVAASNEFVAAILPARAARPLTASLARVIRPEERWAVLLASPQFQVH